MRLPVFVLTGALALTLSTGCSFKKMTAGMTVSVAKDASVGLEQESDYELAEAAGPGNLKFIEGLYFIVPDNPDLLEMLARGYASLSFAFLEDRASEARANGDEKLSDKLTERAVGLYERGARYGMKLLGMKRGFDAAWEKGGAALEQKLVEFGKDEAGALFWTAYAWVGAINLAQDRVENLVMLPKVVQLLNRVVVVDEAYLFGTAHIVLGGYHMSLPKLLGGKPEKAKEHFEKGIAISGGKALLGKVLYAHLYAARTNDRPLFDKLIKEIEEASLDDLPGARLSNVIAKRKAARLKKRTEELF